MCACRQKKSFLIEDILGDTKKKPYKNLSNEPSKPLVCTKKPTENVRSTEEINRVYKDQATEPAVLDEKLTKFNVIAEVQHEMEMSKINLEQRRNTYPLYPTPVKANYPWNYRGPTKEPASYLEPRMGYYSDQMLNTSQLLRNQLAANRFVSHTFAIRQAYGFDRVAPNCCSPWWGIGGRRKGGQVRFTAAQTGALERRFNATKYLSPDERRALASTLRLSDRQVKTWFQNRRAKWRRCAPESADAGSPPSGSPPSGSPSSGSPSTSGDGSDDEVHIADDDTII